MKLDLADLEHDARGTPVGRCPSDHPMSMPPHGCAATRLALIARIRELEGVAVRYAGALGREGYDEQAAEVRAIVEKGAVLP